ncbi:MAG: molybdopterin-synthase adenylyltransferase MoeB, partial [Acidobacteriaceae bacterium]|nr:molybdopterin-synthase adenylyltransferase MoeB [Acidobacteriaceae bacterium]
ALRQFTNQNDSVEVTGATVTDALNHLTAQYPDIKKNLFNDQGKLRSFVNVYVNDEDIRYLDKDETTLEGNETISIVPSIAGGAAVLAEPETASLSNEEIARYSRHLILPEVGMQGQLKLKQAKVAMIGAGGLGAPVGLYLAAAGIGRIGLVDFDVVDASNLQRQVIHGTADLGRKKLDSAEDRMRDINPNLEVDKFDTGLSSENALEILKDYDLVIDGTDNFPTRYLVNDACVLLKKPNVYGSIFRFEGQATVFAYEDGPCYRCLYPEPPPPGLVPSCAEGGVLGILPGLIGVIQATEAVKIILGTGETLKNRLLLYDALNMRFRELRLRRERNCPVCGDHPSITQLIDYQEFCGMRSAPPQPVAADAAVDAVELKQKLDRGDKFTLIDVREPHEYQIGRIPGARLIPLGELSKHLNEFDPNEELVMHCKSGARSQKAVDLLKQNGFRNVRNMTGGITAWSDKVDPSVPKY